MKPRYIEYEIIPWTGCHICTSHSPDYKGYIPIRRAGKQYRLHRWIWEQENGPIPEGLFVLHKCDNRDCINLNHLYVGTHQDNMLDRRIRNRTPKGEQNGRSKLTRLQVSEIKSSGEKLRILSKKFEVSFQQISKIRNGKAWKSGGF